MNFLAAAAVVTTGQYDNYRTGANLTETVLNLSNVNVSSFGRLGSYSVDGEVHAQPLYVSGLNLGGGTLTNVLFIATMHNTVYAFDANKLGSPPLWKTTLAPSVPVLYAGSCPAWSTGSEAGILSTPVIDLQSNTIYAVYTTPSGSNTYAHYIAALDITSGQHKPGSPNHIVASTAGIGYDSVNGSVSLNETTQLQRPALTLLNGLVYAAFASCGNDMDPFHGWVVGYNASNISSQVSVYSSTPNGQEGGIWQGGRGLAVDKSNNLYASTGNGSNSSTDSSDSVVKFGSAGQAIGVYTDPNAAVLSEYDLDLSSSGPLYMPGNGLLLAGGKEGIMHVLDPTKIGAAGSSVVQSFPATLPCGTYSPDSCYQIYSIAYWDSSSNPLLYVWGNGDILRAYRFSGGTFNTTADSVGTMAAQVYGAAISLSANGSDASTAIVWSVTLDGYLHAYQATNVANEIYNSGQDSTRDSLGNPTHFIGPVVADGKVFVATRDNQIQVYGALGSGTVTNPTASARFLTADTATAGNWASMYGVDGYSVAGDQTLNPSYAGPTVAGQSAFTWASSTTDARALQKPSNRSDRIAATWYSGSSFVIDSNISDQVQHQVAIYCLDWDTTSRRETIDVLDTNGNVLDSQPISVSFYGGVYLVWNVAGHVKFRITTTAGPNAVISGIFFGGPVAPASPATATFVGADGATQGTWRTAYGADGYSVVGDQTSNPAYAATLVSGASASTWQGSTNDVRALQKASNPNDRIAATWFSPGSFIIDTNISDQVQHKVALYFLDWDTTGRRQTIDVLDSSGNVLDTRSLGLSFNSGIYFVWNVTGHVKFRVTFTAGANAVASGIFVGGPLIAPSPATASFIGSDATTQGNWRTAYGVDGYSVAGDQQLNPAYAAPALSGQSSFTWLNSTADARALQKPSNASDRIAAVWYADSSFVIDTNISDQQQHKVALYNLDWDGTDRRQTIDVLDAGGNVLNTQRLAGTFHDGVYLVWNVTGHVKFRVTSTAGPNAVTSGIFFGGGQPASPASATFVKADTATQGSWKSVYGADGYSVAGDQTLNPAYAAPVSSGQPYTWLASTSDVRALQKPLNPADRLAATWFGNAFVIDPHISDQVQHQVALYFLDWDSTARTQTIDVLDAGGNVLNTQSLASSFNSGVYLVWNVSGPVRFRITTTSADNAVVSGIFFH